MSWTQIPKSFYEEQKKKYLAKHPEMKTYYDDKPMAVFSGGRASSKPSHSWLEINRRSAAKLPRPTKPCQRCGKPIEKPLREGAKTWEQRKFHSLCKKLHHETMLNVSNSN